MKRILIISLLILLIPILAISADKIVKVGENNVEVTPSKTLKDTSDIEFVIWDEKNTRSYGQDGIDKEKVKAQDEMTDAQNLNEVVYKQGIESAAQDRINKITIVLNTVSTKEMIDTKGIKFNVYEIPLEYEEVGFNQGNLEKAKKTLTDAQNFNTAEYKQDLIDKAQAKIDKLNLIQAEMNK